MAIEYTKNFPGCPSGSHFILSWDREGEQPTPAQKKEAAVEDRRRHCPRCWGEVERALDLLDGDQGTDSDDRLVQLYQTVDSTEAAAQLRMASEAGGQFARNRNVHGEAARALYLAATLVAHQAAGVEEALDLLTGHTRQWRVLDYEQAGNFDESAVYDSFEEALCAWRRGCGSNPHAQGLVVDDVGRWFGGLDENQLRVFIENLPQ